LIRTSILAAALLAAGVAVAEPEDPVAPPTPLAPDVSALPAGPLPDAREIAQRAEEVLRGQGTRIEATMTIFSRKRRRARVITLRVFDDRRDDRALVRVLSPEKHAGTALLKLPPNLWLFSPEKRETTRLPGPTWSEAFLGSDFSRDDLVRGSSGALDYDHRVLEVDLHAGEAGDQRAFVVEYTAHPGARAAWARIVAWIEVEHATPLRLDYYAADGVLFRTLRLDDVREVAGRRFPHRWVMRRTGAEGRETQIQVDRIRFDPHFEAGLFTTSRLDPEG